MGRSHYIAVLSVCVSLRLGLAATLLGQEFTLSDADFDAPPVPMFATLAEPANLWTVEADYLMWWTRSARAPALISSSAEGTLREDAGVLGEPSTDILFGDQGLDGGRRSGLRLAVERQLPTLGMTSLYANGFYLGDDRKSGNDSAGSDGSLILARPFLNAQTGREDSQLVAFPDVLAGHVAVESFSELHGAEIGFRQPFLLESPANAFLAVGYRFLSYRDFLNVREDLRSIDEGGVVPLDTRFKVHDQFNADARFHGANLGLGLQGSRGSWGGSVLSSLALGGLTRELSVNGRTEVTVPGEATDTTAGGLLAQPTNIGSYRSTRLVMIPELHAKIHRRVSDNISLDFGYDLLVVPHVWRSAEQIDRTVNDSQIGGEPLVGTARPRISERPQTLWIQGISFGLTANW